MLPCRVVQGCTSATALIISRGHAARSAHPQAAAPPRAALHRDGSLRRAVARAARGSLRRTALGGRRHPVPRDGGRAQLAGAGRLLLPGCLLRSGFAAFARPRRRAVPPSPPYLELGGDGARRRRLLPRATPPAVPTLRRLGLSPALRTQPTRAASRSRLHPRSWRAKFARRSASTSAAAAATYRLGLSLCTLSVAGVALASLRCSVPPARARSCSSSCAHRASSSAAASPRSSVLKALEPFPTRAAAAAGWWCTAMRTPAPSPSNASNSAAQALRGGAPAAAGGGTMPRRTALARSALGQVRARGSACARRKRGDHHQRWTRAARRRTMRRARGVSEAGKAVADRRRRAM